ncbi:MAG: mechanosensitive ion channel family protein [Moorea sp. SIO2B7]|nr:mechanosensitive ion channel family protein [Moorena sp. SIO2B7]
MDKFISQIQKFQIQNLILPLVLIIGSFFLGFVFEKRILKKLKILTQRSRWKELEIIVNSLSGMTFIWIVIAGFYLAILTISLSDALLDIIEKVLLATFLVSVTLVVSRLAVSLIQLYTSRGEESATLTSLFETLTKLLIFSLGILIILQSIGIAISPLLTALGVGGISLSLALQGPLSNFISGITIITSKKIRPGDYLKLKSGEEGYVTDVELKYTIIKEITGNLLVVPNAKIISSSFKNYGLPEKEMLVPIEVGVSYDSDLEKVETVTLEVAQEVMTEVKGGVPEYEPFIRYNKFDYFSINFTVYLQVKEYYDYLIITHEFIKRIHKRYQAESIKIPFPVKTGYGFSESERDSFGEKINKE